MGTGESRTRLLVQAVGALVVYQVAAIALFGRALLSNFSRLHAGGGPDPQFYIWSLLWWPYALAHRLNPFITQIIWRPEGFNLAWATSLPLQSLVAAPITLRFGPVVAFNVLVLIMPALTALAAFVLARHLVGRLWPALLAGYLFGFSPFMVGQQWAGHIFMTAAFLIPIAIHLVLLRFEQRLGVAAFVALLTLTLVCQFLLGMELFASLILFGAIGLILAWFFWPLFRRRVESVAFWCAVSILAAAIVLSPFLFYVLRGSGAGTHPFWSGAPGTDLIELLVPSPIFLIGQIPWLQAVSRLYAHTRNNTGGYVGLPLLAIAIVYFVTRWKRPEARFMAATCAIAYVCMLGGRIYIAGHEFFGLPWKLLVKLPFINSANPIRFSVYLDLVLALAAAILISEIDWPAAAKWATAAVTAAALLPNLNASAWARGLGVPESFISGMYRHYLEPGETVMVLPYGEQGNEMMWQALSGMYFSMPEGWTGPPPRSFISWPVIDALQRDITIPDEPRQLSAFLATHGVSAVIFDRDNAQAPHWMALLEADGARIENVGSVVIARPAPAALARYRDTTALQMECRLDLARVDRLLVAGDQYLRRGYPLEGLTPLAAVHAGLLPADWLAPDESNTIFASSGLWLGPWRANRISVGVNASSGCAEPLIARYGHNAAEVLFPYPHPFHRSSHDYFARKLVMVFTREAFNQTARAVEANPLPDLGDTAAPPAVRANGTRTTAP